MCIYMGAKIVFIFYIRCISANNSQIVIRENDNRASDSNINVTSGQESHSSLYKRLYPIINNKVST